MDIHDACENGNIEFLIKVLTDTTSKTKKFTVYTKDENSKRDHTTVQERSH